MRNDLHQDCHVLDTRLPERHTIEGLEQGRHVTAPGWSVYYVCPAGTVIHSVARLTPADDELQDNDAAIVDAIHAERSISACASLDALAEAMRHHESITLDRHGLWRTGLPDFGGEPVDYETLWSWDADRVLMGTARMILPSLHA